VVTGASRGIGLASARALALRGAHVFMVARRTKPLDIAVAKILESGLLASAISADMGDPSAAGQILAAVSAVGRLDIVVNNAGSDLEAPLADTSDADWERLLQVNVVGPFRLLRECEDLLAASSCARVVNIASVFAVVGVANWVAYGASKGGVISGSRALAVEWASKGINVNVVAPGHTATDMTAKAFTDPQMMRRIEHRIPLGRAGSPTDIAEVVSFLSGDGASWITGQVHNVDGGWSCR
jgi:NAD(P)-dependent dehydrogenase (short-subunit alcohol dehydrogenase family)